MIFSEAIAQDEIVLSELSYTQFIEKIKKSNEKVFSLNNTLVKFNPDSDNTFKAYFTHEDSIYSPYSKSIIIDKEIILENVHFQYNYTERDTLNNHLIRSASGVLNNIIFNKTVTIKECASLKISNSTFKQGFVFNSKNVFDQENISIPSYSKGLDFRRNTVEKKFHITISPTSEDSFAQLFCSFNTITIPENFDSIYLNISLNKVVYQGFRNNTIKGGGRNFFNLKNGNWVNFSENNFYRNSPDISISKISGLNQLDFKNNFFEYYVFFDIDKFSATYSIDWAQFKETFIEGGAYNKYVIDFEDHNPLGSENNNFFSKREGHYLYHDSAMVSFKPAYDLEIAARGKFYNHYKTIFNRENANEVYIDLKNIETERLKLNWRQNPSFDNFFTLKINQFLKVFSDYGTRPSKSVIFSIYIILIFAFIYFLFPNHWDEDSKRKLINRFTFFFKYFKQKEGMNEIYLQSQNSKLSSYMEFKKQIDQTTTLELPAFFIKWSKPIYKLALLRSNFQAYILRKTDVLRGSWTETSQKGRKSKAIITGIYLVLVLLYDLLVRILNAITLSINTFTTLGFGEIPIKGFPRHLAVLQGFIGWFMLTIFSVSLISQILN